MILSGIPLRSGGPQPDLAMQSQQSRPQSALKMTLFAVARRIIDGLLRVKNREPIGQIGGLERPRLIRHAPSCDIPDWNLSEWAYVGRDHERSYQ